MYNDDFKLTSSAVILAALLLAATDTKATNIAESTDSRLTTADSNGTLIAHPPKHQAGFR